MARKKEQDFYGILQSFVSELYEDGTATRWKADKRMKAQIRELNRLDREQRAIQKALEEQGLKKSA